MKIGRSLLDHLGSKVKPLALQVQSALRIEGRQIDDLAVAEALAREIDIAESHESLRLIASAYRENLAEEDRCKCYVVRLGAWQATAWNVASATALRSPTIPVGAKQIIRVEDGQETELVGVEGTLTVLRPALERCQRAPDDSAWTRLLHASHQSVLNEAMAQVYRHGWGAHIESVIALAGGLDAYLAMPEIDGYALFNRLPAFDARQMMPFSKMRLDLLPADVLAYSPEFAPSVRIRFAALRRETARISLSRSETSFGTCFDALFPGLRPCWAAALSAAGHDADHYHPLPLHPLNEPWVRERLGGLVARGDLVLLPGIEIESIPSLSLRSMLLPQQCLKLPVPLQTTHLIRDVAVKEIELGPLLSDVLHEIVDQEHASADLVLERDLLGLYVDPALEGMSTELSAMLGFVSRQSPQALAAPDEHVIPVAALFSTLPGRSQPFFFDLLHQAGADTLDAQMAYFEEHVRRVVDTQLDLYFRCGVMLEAHQQNLNLVYGPDWRLRRLMYHDIPGGVAAYLPLLRARYLIPETFAALFYFRETPERSVFQFVHPTLTSHLGPLTLQIARILKVDRARLVAIIRGRIQACIAAGRKVIAESEAEAQARTKLIDTFEQIVLGSATLPGKMMLGRLYLQSLNSEWGKTVPNPELLSARVLIAPCDIGNFLNADASA